jgi:hypothetical protein
VRVVSCADLDPAQQELRPAQVRLPLVAAKGELLEPLLLRGERGLPRVVYSWTRGTPDNCVVLSCVVRCVVCGVLNVGTPPRNRFRWIRSWRWTRGGRWRPSAWADRNRRSSGTSSASTIRGSTSPGRTNTTSRTRPGSTFRATRRPRPGTSRCRAWYPPRITATRRRLQVDSCRRRRPLIRARARRRHRHRHHRRQAGLI